MGNADKPLRFKLLPCPHCGGKITLGDLWEIGENEWALLHYCPKATPRGCTVEATGDNVRMTVQKWNKYAKEWRP